MLPNLSLLCFSSTALYHVPGFRQFDLFLDGLSYFEMPKIYTLGVSHSRALVQTLPEQAYGGEGPIYNNYSLPPQEQVYQDRNFQHYEKRTPNVADIAHRPTQPLQWTAVQSEYMPTDMLSDPTPIMETQDHFATPVSVMDQQSTASFASAPTTSYDEFTPVVPVAQVPSPAIVHNQILSAYGSASPVESSPVLALANESHTYYQPTSSAVPSTPSSNNTPPAASYYEPQNNYATPSVPAWQQSAPSVVSPETSPSPQAVAPAALTMSGHLQVPEEEPLSQMELALKSLVNFDDIATPLKTPEQLKREQKKEEEAGKHPKSYGLPPTTPSWHLGNKACLNDIKENTEPRAAPSKEVMRTHAFDPRAAAAGMMVVYGHPANYYPQQIQSYGFGVTASTQMAAYNQMHYGYAPQQQSYAAY
jgi:hypothetical protein